MVPQNVSTTLAKRDTPWSTLALKDFTSKSWPELTDAEKRRIGGHFAWAAASPAPTFGDLKLGHHRPSDGAVVFHGVAAALGRLDQTDGLGTEKAAVRAHLEAHRAAFEATAPKGLDSLTRAYSTIIFKAVDEEQRVIEGTASSPETDRIGDVLESTGAKFSLPLPLLWQHRHDQPIGHVVSATVTNSGIRIRAQIAKGVLPRIDEAWALIKAGLVRGLSVGFRAIDAEPIKGGGGLRFKAWEWIELSAVTVPANASASIASIKSFDVDRPAASGRAGPVSSNRSGASDASRNRQMNNSERLTARKAELKTKSARLEEIQTGAENEAPSDALKLESKTLVSEIDDINSEVDRLEAIEKSQARIAAKVIATGTQDGSRARDVDTKHVVEVKSVLPPGIEFARYLICKMAQLVSHGNVTALEVAKARYPDQPRIQMLLKAAVGAMTSADGSQTGGTELVYAQNLVSEFVEWLRPMTIIGKFGTGNIPTLRRIPFNVRLLGQGSGGAGYWVGQGKQKPLKKYDFGAQTFGFAKVAAIAVISDELARFSSPSAEVLVRDALSGSLTERLDIDFIDPTKAAVPNVSPASITNGLVALTPGGTDAAAVRADIGQILAAVIAANLDPTNGVFIMPNSIALALSLMRTALGQPEFPNITMRGGTLEGFPVIASQYAVSGSPANNLVIFVVASEVFLADDGQATVDVSREASLEMESDPENQTGSVVSMFQANCLALRAERFINWGKRQPAGVAYLDGVQWGGGSPTP